MKNEWINGLMNQSFLTFQTQIYFVIRFGAGPKKTSLIHFVFTNFPMLLIINLIDHKTK